MFDFLKNLFDILNNLTTILVIFGGIISFFFREKIKHLFKKKVIEAQENYKTELAEYKNNLLVNILAQRVRLWVAPKRGFVCLAP